MVMVLINWLYIALTSFLAGYGILGLFANLSGYRVRHRIAYIFAGLTFATVYAQFFSLFTGVSVAANVGLLLVCIFTTCMYRKELTEFFENEKRILQKEHIL